MDGAVEYRAVFCKFIKIIRKKFFSVRNKTGSSRIIYMTGEMIHAYYCCRDKNRIWKSRRKA